MGDVRHTPGPWHVGREHGESQLRPSIQIMRDVTYVEGTKPVTYVIGEVTYPTTTGNTVGSEERRANARLMAAAPELLDALSMLMSLHEPEGRFQPSHYKPVLRMAREAIAKAMGVSIEACGVNEYRYREALVEIAHGATGHLDRDTDLANIAKRALGIEVSE